MNSSATYEERKTHDEQKGPAFECSICYEVPTEPVAT